MNNKFNILFFILIIILIFSCSTTGKEATAIYTIKNDAAGYLKVADNFLASEQYLSALQYYSEALDSNLSVDNIEGAIAARSSMGRVYIKLNRWQDAERELGDALEDARAFNNGEVIALCLSNFGELRYQEKKYDDADKLFLEAESLVTTKSEIAPVIANNRGITFKAKGQLETAIEYVTKAAELNEKAKHWAELGANYYTLSAIKNQQNLIPESILFMEQALASDKKAENSIGIGLDLVALAKLNIKINENEKAFDYYRRAFGLYLAKNQANEAKNCLEALLALAKQLSKETYITRYENLLNNLNEIE